MPLTNSDSSAFAGFADREYLCAVFELEALLDAPAVRRLEQVSFLGILGPGAHADVRDNRWAHSIRAAAIAGARALELGATYETARHLVAAAVVHDIAHRAYSHTLERAFASLTGRSPRRVTELLITDLGIGEDIGVAKALGTLGLSSQRVLTFLDDRLAQARLQADAPFALWWRGSLSPDTLDGMQRTQVLFGRSVRDERFAQVFARLANGHIGVAASALGVTDAFWLMKSDIYSWINARTERETSFARVFIKAMAPSLEFERTFQLREREVDLGTARTPATAEQLSILSDEYENRFRLPRHYWVDTSARIDDQILDAVALRSRYRGASIAA